MVTMLEAVRSSSGYSASCSLANPSTNADGLVVEDVVGLHEHAELARRRRLGLEAVEVLDHLRVLVHPLDRVGLEDELVLHDDAADEHGEARRR